MCVREHEQRGDPINQFQIPLDADRVSSRTSCEFYPYGSGYQSSYVLSFHEAYQS